MEMDTQQNVIRAYKIGRLNREEAIHHLRRLEPNLMAPVLEILLNAVSRHNVVKLNNRKIKNAPSSSTTDR